MADKGRSRNPVEWVNRFKENNEISDDDEETHSEHADISIESDSLKRLWNKFKTVSLKFRLKYNLTPVWINLISTVQTPFVHYDPNGLPAAFAPKGKLEDLIQNSKGS